MKDLLIGCDVGTSSTKAVVMDAGGHVLCSAQQSYGLILEKSQWAEQWPQVWLDAAVAVISSLTSQIDPKRVAAASISALYGGSGVLMGEKGEALRPAIIWMDRRAEEESQLLRDTIGEKEIFDVSGNGIDSYFGYVKLKWVQKHEPEIWKKTRMVLPVHTYLIWKMTGSMAVDYCSAGNVGGIYDIKKSSWSKKMCLQLNIDQDFLPQTLVEPDRLIGELNREYAHLLNLPEGTPFTAGTVDCIAAMLSAGVIREGSSAAILGTSLNWGFVHKEVPNDPNLISMPYCVQPQTMYYTYGGASTAGALPRWFIQNILKSNDSSLYDQLEKEVNKKMIPAGSQELLMLPYFMGERTPIWDEKASGLIMGLSLHHDRANVYRAILESTAYSLRHIIESCSESISDRMILVGGGAVSQLWKQILADVTGKTIIMPTKSVEAPLGDAFMAAKAVGLQSSYEGILDWISYEEPILPQEKDRVVYDRFYKNYKKLYIAVKEIMHDLKQDADLTK